MNALPRLFIHFIALALVFQQAEKAGGYRSSITRLNHVNGTVIGAILDTGSREGKEARVAMEIALHDLNINTNQTFLLRMRNSRSNPQRAATAARQLINKHQAEAIIGLHTWEEVSLVAEGSVKSHVPIISLAASTPQWATTRWPFFVQSFPSQYAQMKTLAAIIQTWEWHQITLIYEDGNLGTNELFPHLTDALQEAGVRINLIQIPPFTSNSLPGQLEKLMEEKCRVFVVHASLSTAINMFYHAKRMKMMEKEYVWITTSMATNLFHSLNVSAISLMQGVLGIKSYFPDTGSDFQNFRNSFRKKFSIQYPQEENYEPGIFAVQAYDATLVVAQALKKANMSPGLLLEKIPTLDFNGLSGKITLNGRKLAPASVFRIVNVVEKSFRELGLWSDGLGRGFSEFIDERGIFNSSMVELGPVLWPGKPWYTPRGWVPTTNGRSLKVGVPSRSSFKKYVNVEYDPKSDSYSFSGLSIQIFEEAIASLPYHVQYEFLPFEGTFDDLVKQVYLQKFNAIAGDVSIIASRYKYAEFTHPYTETGLVMIVPVRSELCNKAWLFMKPFTKSMWALTIVITIYNGFVVWFIERDQIPELGGSSLNPIGILIWLAFSSLFSLHGGNLRSNLSRIAMVVWLFVALIITQSYTASLTSMLTVQRLVPTVPDVETLKNSNALVGYGRGSFVSDYLRDVLGLKFDNLKRFISPEEYSVALKSGEIAAAFLEVPYAKIFLAEYCDSFMRVGPTYKVGGFGFVFPKGSPMLPDVTEALLNLSENGRLKELEDGLIGSVECVDQELKKETSLSLNSFFILFIFTGGTSTISLVAYIVMTKWKFQNYSLFQHRTLLAVLLVMMKVWEYRRRRFSRRVNDVETATNNPPGW